MNSKAQMGQLGVFLMAFIAIIVGAILFVAVGQQIGTTTLTQDEANQTVTLPAEGSVVNLNGRAVEGTPIVTNATGGAVVPASNYTVLNNQIDSTTGELTAQLQSDGGLYEAQSVNVSYTYQPTTYADDSGTRGVISIIAIFMALGILVVALIPAARSGVMDLMRK